MIATLAAMVSQRYTNISEYFRDVKQTHVSRVPIKRIAVSKSCNRSQHFIKHFHSQYSYSFEYSIVVTSQKVYTVKRRVWFSLDTGICMIFISWWGGLSAPTSSDTVPKFTLYRAETNYFHYKVIRPFEYKEYSVQTLFIH